MISLPRPAPSRSFEFQPDFDRPESIPHCGRTLSWQEITLSYPSPPMSSPPSPRRKLLDRPTTANTTSTPFLTSTSNSASASTSTSTSLPPPNTTTTNVAVRVISSSAPLSNSAQFASSTSSGINPATTNPALTQRQSASSNESNQLYRTESASSASNIPDIQPTAGPSNLNDTANAGRGGRRTKAHVANACGNCKHAHLSCDVERPCNRCVATGKADTCRDVAHKKRGRPRLRDEAEFRVQQPETTFASAPESSEAGPSTISSRPVPGSRHRRQGSLRTLRAVEAGTSPSNLASQPPGMVAPFVSQPSTARMPQTPVIPIAFLDLDLVIMKANAAFQQLVKGLQRVEGVRLSDIARPSDGDSFQNARNRLREEREAKDPSYLPPILRGGIDPVIGITDANVEEVTRGFADQHHNWTFRLTSGIEHMLPVRVRLAKTTHYFVTLFLPPLPASQTQTEHFPPAQNHPPQMFASLPAPIPHFLSNPPYLDPTLRPRDTQNYPAPPSLFYPYSGAGTPTLQAPTAGPSTSSRAYPSPDQQYQFPPPPPQYQYQYQYQQLPNFHSRPSSSGTTGGLPPISERPPTAGSSGSITHLFPSFPSTRQRSDTMDSLGSHISRLRADSGATFSLPAQPSSQRPQQLVASTSSSESAGSEVEKSPRKRRKMGINEVLQG